MTLKKLIILTLLSFIANLHAQDERIHLSFYFDHNSHTLSEKHKHTIDSISHLFSSDITKVELRGYTNGIGPMDHNDLLSQKKEQIP
jgi:outer membrane protein OmpA-like peptidoglycan-associated protein